MKCWLTQNTKLYTVLQTIAHGYETGDFKSLNSFLAEDCVLESHWVLQPNEGKKAIAAYFTGKGKTLKRTKSFPKCDINEIVGNMTTVSDVSVTTDGENYEKASVGLTHTSGKLCLLMTQKLENETVNVLIDVIIDETGFVKRIDLCDPEFFTCRPIGTNVCLNPGNKAADEKDDAVLVFEDYYPEMYTFLFLAGIDFDEYDVVEMPMDKWVAALRFWERFYAAGSFDEAFEELAGASYVDGGWEIKNQEIARKFSRFGKRIWDNRDMGQVLLKRLMEWTDLYRGDYDCIISEGW